MNYILIKINKNKIFNKLIKENDSKNKLISKKNILYEK
jgi:hypothetical protein